MAFHRSSYRIGIDHRQPNGKQAGSETWLHQRVAIPSLELADLWHLPQMDVEIQTQASTVQLQSTATADIFQLLWWDVVCQHVRNRHLMWPDFMQAALLQPSIFVKETLRWKAQGQAKTLIPPRVDTHIQGVPTNAKYHRVPQTWQEGIGHPEAGEF